MVRFFPENLIKHWESPHGLIQVFVGPRQVGKTTTATQLAPVHHTIFLSADSPSTPSASIIAEHWLQARAILSPERTRPNGDRP